MVNKYKLIKKYPGCSKLDTYVYKVDSIKGYYYIETNSEITYSREEVEDYPEFWDEYPEKTLKYGVTEDFHPVSSYNSNHYPAWFKWFDDEKQRDLYIKENKLQYSELDMISFAVYARGISGATTTSKCFKHWAESCYNTKK